MSVFVLIPELHLCKQLCRTELPFYQKHPKRTGAALGIAGGVMLAPVAGVGALVAAGFGTAGVAAGKLVAYPPK